mmetsp:Transcript_19686/g.37082  ORF Transcript_19686/g.37082 Transcript_19686/m.37082 type:complete len:338 (+) Transcript_19686:48-1061(+)
MLALRDVKHVIHCAVDDAVQVDDFPHIIWEYYGESEQQENDNAEEEESTEDEGKEEVSILQTGHGNTKQSTGQRVPIETGFGVAGRLGADHGAVGEVPNAVSEASMSTASRLNSPLSVPPLAFSSPPSSSRHDFQAAPTSFESCAMPFSIDAQPSSGPAAAESNSDGLMTVNDWVGGSASSRVAQPKRCGNDKNKHANRCRQKKTELIETLMLRKVPSTWGKTRLMKELDNAGYFGSYNFIYVPANSKMETMENNGYAFVNFMHAFPNVYCHKLKALRSRFLVLPAKVQGLQANVDFFRHKGVSFSYTDFEFAPHVKYDNDCSSIEHSSNSCPVIHA